MYNSSFTQIIDYVPEVKVESTTEAKISVDSLEGLSKAIISFIEKEEDTGAVIFSSNYPGDPSADVSTVCKQIITRNPLCAYCVENIDYEIYKVLSTTETAIYITYAANAEPISSVIRLAYSGELKNTLTGILADGKRKAAILINHSDLSDTDIKDLIQNLYYSSPLCAPSEPSISITMFSDSANQRLYEIIFDYHITDEEYIKFLSDLETKLYVYPEFDRKGDLYEVIKATSYILCHCELSSGAYENTAYSALFKGKADSKGLSLALISLCKDLGIECRLVYGQKAWQNHYWNLVRIEGNWYHVDLAECMLNGIESGFLLNDDGMWKNYRWNLSEYPQSSSAISYSKAYFTNAEEFYSEIAEDS